MKTNKSIVAELAILVLLLLALAGGWLSARSLINKEFGTSKFDGNEAFLFIEKQMDMGARIEDGYAHIIIISWLELQLKRFGWNVEIQKGFVQGFPIENVIAYRSALPPKMILAAHYDSRLQADQDPDPNLRTKPVPGANDGASGVAVLLELAKTLPETTTSTWLVFFDAEDNGGIGGRSWSMGSQYFVSHLSFAPEKVVILDMVGDKDLNIYMERNSDPKLNAEIWNAAGQLGFQKFFISTSKYAMMDDHSPFIKNGIPALDIIDFDYPFWHTTHDTIDKVSPQSLEVVGKTIYYWLTNQYQYMDKP